MILELLAVVLLAGSGMSKTTTNKPNNKRISGNSFEEADSFFDRDGNEHIVDEEVYCEECDEHYDC